MQTRWRDTSRGVSAVALHVCLHVRDADVTQLQLKAVNLRNAHAGNLRAFS